MGFFSDLKEDLSQAVNELIPEDEKIRTGEETAQEPPVSLDEMLKKIDDVRLPEGEDAEQAEEKQPESGSEAGAAEEALPEGGNDTVPETAHSDEDMEKLLAKMLEESPDSEPQEDIRKETADEENKGAEEKMEFENSRVATDETSVITEGMTITGDIMTQGSIDVVGTVNGNIDALGKLNITGHVNGNSKAAEIYAESAKINGEVVSEGAVKIGASSVIIGNISATSAAIAGAVKGDIDVKGPVILDASAIVMGNIKSKSVQINNGAVIEGMCSQCYADVSPTLFFDDYKPDVAHKAKSK